MWENTSRCRRERRQIWRTVKAALSKADGCSNTIGTLGFVAILCAGSPQTRCPMQVVKAKRRLN
jgi:hypothetical protein